MEGKSMNAFYRSRWLVSTVSAALIAAVLLGSLAPAMGDSAAARERRARPREVLSFSNPAQLGVGGGDDAPAVRSSISVSGFDTLVADVNVTLHNINFGGASSQDIDVLLIGPQGQTALVLSDAGGNTATSNATLALDDKAANHLPSNTAMTSGTFQPTNFGTPDTFQLPEGGNFTPSSGSALGIFNGTDPNGTWQLLTFDDDGNGSTGFISGGWSMLITSANGVPSAQPESFQAQAGKTLSVDGPGVLQHDSDPDGDILTAILAGKPKKGQVELQSDGSFTYKSSKKAKGTDTFTYLAQDPGGLNALAEVTIQVKGKKQHSKKHKK
jgi:hypothetical protein